MGETLRSGATVRGHCTKRSIDSTIERLISSLPEEDFGLGMICYIEPDISFSEAFHLNQYRSMPFLLKLSNHQDSAVRAV
jgi:hypothetical protein